MNISSAIVYAIPQQAAAVRARLAALGGVEIHTETGDGRFVVTVEDVPGTSTADTVMRLHQLAAQQGESGGTIRWDKAACRFCGTGCGVLVGTQGGRVVATQGDPEAEVNRGLNCVKGYFLSKIMYGADRLRTPLLRKTCPDCHVPREWGPKIVRKIQASNELLHKVLGSIDTPEKFQAKRHVLAEHEWARMKANDSQECRNCHHFEFMDLTEQGRRAAKAHPVAFGTGMTCIDCHKGIAHQLPPIEQEIGAPKPVSAKTD